MSAGDASTSPVKEFYKGANIFITGATGFLGSALIEKLLRTAPDSGAIFVLMRPKKGKEVSARLEALTKDPVFSVVRETRGPDCFSKLVPVAGDVGEEGLGLSPADRSMLVQKVNVVFHAAATLDFEAKLKPTVMINLLGTRRVLELCREMIGLKALVHVSSAYVNSNRRQADEVLYAPPADAEKIIGLATSLSDEALDDLTTSLLGDHLNTYTFTKALAEHEVAKLAKEFPAAIIRPSMITSAWKEPIPGWTSSKNGPTGFLMGAAKGVVRRLPVGRDLVYDYIPVDVVVNEMMVAAWRIGTTRPNVVTVLHATSSTCNPFRWQEIESKINSYLHRFPLKSAVWYPRLKLLPSLTLFRVSAIFVHFLPALVLDTVTKLCGGRPILWRLHSNVNKSLSRLEPFIFTEWWFDNRCTRELHASLSPADKETFGLDITALAWDNYFVDMAQGVRQYLNNEKPRNLEAARRKDKMLMMLHLLLQAVLFGFIWWLSTFILRTTFTRSGWVVIVIYFLFSFL